MFFLNLEKKVIMMMKMMISIIIQLLFSTNQMMNFLNKLLTFKSNLKQRLKKNQFF